MADRVLMSSRADSPTKILLVDDHRLFRAGLRALIAQSSDCRVIGEATTGDQAFAFLASAQVDLVVMDIHLPDINGIAASRRILESYPTVKILAISSDPSAALVHEAMLAGIAGYMLKENTSEQFQHALAAILTHKVYLCPEVSTSIMDNYRHQYGAASTPPRSVPVLSEREIELLRHIADGMRNKEIAERLGLSVKSAETYRQRLMKKLQLDSTAALTRYAVREGIVKA